MRTVEHVTYLLLANLLTQYLITLLWVYKTVYLFR